MKNEFFLHFENGMPKGTSQQKGERIAYKYDNGRRVPYIQHFKKAAVSTTRQEFELRLKKHRPKEPSALPVKLTVLLYFDIKDRKLWGHPKVTRPDCSNFVKELEDAMTSVGYWYDDSQIVELRVAKWYAEKATIYIKVEEVEL